MASNTLIMSGSLPVADAKRLANQLSKVPSVLATAALGRTSEGKLETVACEAPVCDIPGLNGELDPTVIGNLLKKGLVRPLVELMAGPLGHVFGWSPAPLISMNEAVAAELGQDFDQLANAIKTDQAVVMAESDDPSFNPNGSHSESNFALLPSENVLIELSALLLHADKAIAVAREGLRADRSAQKSSEEQGFSPVFRAGIDSLSES